MKPFIYKGIKYDGQQLAEDIHTFWFEEEHNVEIPDVLGLPEKINSLHQTALERIRKERKVIPTVVARARNINELFGGLAELGGIYVDDVEYSIDDMVDSVNKYTMNGTPLSFPDVHGLHAKIFKLISSDNEPALSTQSPKQGILRSFGNKIRSIFSFSRK